MLCGGEVFGNSATCRDKWTMYPVKLWPSGKGWERKLHSLAGHCGNLARRNKKGEIRKEMVCKHT